MTAQVDIAMSAKGGEAYFVLAMERQLWLALRFFPNLLV
jgi:hypothetical protein